MDPDASLRQLLEALADHDRDAVCELSESLLEWIRKGGFPPTTLGDDSLGIAWHRAIAVAVCQAAVERCQRPTVSAVEPGLEK